MLQEKKGCVPRILYLHTGSWWIFNRTSISVGL
jgi:hypothetical protein